MPRLVRAVRMGRAGTWLRVGVALAAAGFAYVGYVYLTLPDVRELASTNPGTTAFIELRKREAAAAGRRFSVRQRWVPYTQIANNLRRAVLVAEDAAFFDHEGIDLKELRASLELNWEEGRFTRGASTITQQLAKNLYLSPSRNPVRKLKELLITRRLEAALSKRRILEIYLNVIEWGDGIFGAEAASRAYFGKPASTLSADEAVLLAAAIINPRAHNPARPTARLRQRQAIISRRMGVRPVNPAQLSAPTPAADLPQSEDSGVAFSPRNQSPPTPSPPAQSVQPDSGNGVPPPITPSSPVGRSSSRTSRVWRFGWSRSAAFRRGNVYADRSSVRLEQPWEGGINYTGHLTGLMRDIVLRVPALGFIDLHRVLVFARPGRSSADGAYASCHCLGLPTSDPGYFFWRDRQTGAITRRTDWFVTKSPRVCVAGRRVNYLISFALPRFTDQALSRSRKRALYPAGTADWIAKLDTVIHELYHIDPEQTSLRRFPRPDGTWSDALHSPTYFEDVAAIVQQYLATHPDPRLIEFLRYDFQALTARYGGVAGTAFRFFPSYPRRYREAADGPAMPADAQAAPAEPVIDSVCATDFTEADLQLREFRSNTSRVVTPGATPVAA